MPCMRQRGAFDAGLPEESIDRAEATARWRGWSRQGQRPEEAGVVL